MASIVISYKSDSKPQYYDVSIPSHILRWETEGQKMNVLQGLIEPSLSLSHSV